MDEKNDNPMGKVVHIDEARIKDHLGEMVRDAVEVTLNTMLDAEADRLLSKQVSELISRGIGSNRFPCVSFLESVSLRQLPI